MLHQETVSYSTIDVAKWQMDDENEKKYYFYMLTAEF